MTFSKTSKNIREFIFHKVIKLLVKDSFKYLGHMGQKTKQSVKSENQSFDMHFCWSLFVLQQFCYLCVTKYIAIFRLDPWRRSNTCATKCVSSGNKNLSNEGRNQDKPENNWSSYDSGIATAEYSRTRLPSVLHSYDSYRRRAANTTSYNSDDLSPSVGLLDPLRELPSPRFSFEVEEDGQGKHSDAGYYCC